jgi:hypothetical protein
MPNSTTGLFQTLVVPATAEAAQNLVFQNAFLGAIYWDYQPITAVPYQTLNVPIPDVNEGDVADIGAGSITPTDTTHSNVAITLDKHFSSSWVIKSWDQVRTPQDLATKYISPRLEAVRRKMNRSIAGLVTTGNFGTYSLISGSGADVFQRADLSGCWKNLAGAGVPLDDSTKLSFLTSVAAYGNMLGDSNFSQESIVGMTAAQAAQQQARLMPLLGARPYFDQHIGKFNANKEPGIFMHKYAIAGVTANPPSAGGAVQEVTMMIADKVPVQLQFGYSIEHVGWIFHMHCYWGVKVARPDFGSLTETA